MTRKFKFTQRQSPARHVPTIGEQQRPTRNSVEQTNDALAAVKARYGAVDALKASCKPVAAAVSLESAARFLSRFLPTHAGTVRRETVSNVLDMLAGMTSADIAELDRIRRHLRGE